MTDVEKRLEKYLPTLRKVPIKRPECLADIMVGSMVQLSERYTKFRYSEQQNYGTVLSVQGVDDILVSFKIDVPTLVSEVQIRLPMHAIGWVYPSWYFEVLNDRIMMRGHPLLAGSHARQMGYVKTRYPDLYATLGVPDELDRHVPVLDMASFDCMSDYL